jgi:Leucine-rich repeat (LRR) protein
VTCLQRCVSLETLALNGSPVTSEGLRGLENIPTLRSLNVSQCDVSTVVGLTSCYALTSLDLSRTNVDDAGITGLENIASLTRWT